MANIDKILEASQRVIHLRAQLKAAEEELAAYSPGKPAGRTQPARRKPVRGTSAGPSVSQRVLNMVLDAGPVGIARKDLVAVVGSSHEAAIHSALKAHQSHGRIKNDAGQWVATAAYVQQLQAVPSMAPQVDTRPLKAPQAYVGS